MKAILIFVLGLVVGALGLYLYRLQPETGGAVVESERKFSDTARDAAQKAADKTRAVAATVAESVGEKIEAWHLTPADIKAELSKTGQVIRSKAARVEDKVSD